MFPLYCKYYNLLLYMHQSWNSYYIFRNWLLHLLNKTQLLLAWICSKQLVTITISFRMSKCWSGRNILVDFEVRKNTWSNVSNISWKDFLHGWLRVYGVLLLLRGFIAATFVTKHYKLILINSWNADLLDGVFALWPYLNIVEMSSNYPPLRAQKMTSEEGIYFWKQARKYICCTCLPSFLEC